METSEKPFPPEARDFQFLLVEYFREQFTRLQQEGNAQVHQFGATLHEKARELAPEFHKHGVSFRTDIAPLFVRTYADFVALRSLKQALVLLAKEAKKRRATYRQAVRLITADAAPFSRHVKSEVTSTWELIEKIDPAKMSEDIARQVWGEKIGQVSASAKLKGRRQILWRILEKTLFALLTNKGVSENRTYNLMVLLWDTCLPDGFTAKNPATAIRLRVKSVPPEEVP